MQLLDSMPKLSGTTTTTDKYVGLAGNYRSYQIYWLGKKTMVFFFVFPDEASW